MCVCLLEDVRRIINLFMGILGGICGFTHYHTKIVYLVEMKLNYKINGSCKSKAFLYSKLRSVVNRRTDFKLSQSTRKPPHFPNECDVVWSRSRGRRARVRAGTCARVSRHTLAVDEFTHTCCGETWCYMFEKI